MRRNQQNVMAGVLALVLARAVLRAEDWPQWRGPNRDGVWRESGVLELYTDRGELIRAKLDPKGYKEISRARVLQPVYPFGGRKVAWSPPAFANRHIFARTERELVCASLMEKP